MFYAYECRIYIYVHSCVKNDGQPSHSTHINRVCIDAFPFPNIEMNSFCKFKFSTHSLQIPFQSRNLVNVFFCLNGKGFSKTHKEKMAECSSNTHGVCRGGLSVDQNRGLKSRDWPSSHCERKLA